MGKVEHLKQSLCLLLGLVLAGQEGEVLVADLTAPGLGVEALSAYGEEAELAGLKVGAPDSLGLEAVLWVDLKAHFAPGLEAVLAGVELVFLGSQGLDTDTVGLEVGLLDSLGLVDMALSHCHQTVLWARNKNLYRICLVYFLKYILYWKLGFHSRD